MEGNKKGKGKRERKLEKSRRRENMREGEK